MTSGIAGQFSAFSGTPFETGTIFGDLTLGAPEMLPDPMLVMEFAEPLQAVKLLVSVPTAKIEVRDAIEPLQSERPAAHPALVWIETSSPPGVYIINAIAVRDDLPMARLALVFKLKPNTAPLVADEVWVQATVASDEVGGSLLPVTMSKWIE